MMRADWECMPNVNPNIFIILFKIKRFLPFLIVVFLASCTPDAVVNNRINSPNNNDVRIYVQNTEKDFFVKSIYEAYNKRYKVVNSAPYDFEVVPNLIEYDYRIVSTDCDIDGNTAWCEASCNGKAKTLTKVYDSDRKLIDSIKKEAVIKVKNHAGATSGKPAQLAKKRAISYAIGKANSRIAKDIVPKIMHELSSAQKKCSSKPNESTVIKNKLGNIAIITKNIEEISVPFDVSAKCKDKNGYKETYHKRFHVNPKGDVVKIFIQNFKDRYQRVFDQIDVFNSKNNIKDKSKYTLIISPSIEDVNIKKQEITPMQIKAKVLINSNIFDRHGKLISTIESSHSDKTPPLHKIDTYSYSCHDLFEKEDALDGGPLGALGRAIGTRDPRPLLLITTEDLLQSVFVSAVYNLIMTSKKRLIAQARTQYEQYSLPPNLTLDVNFSDENSLLPNNSIDAGEEANFYVSINNNGEGYSYDTKLLISSNKSDILRKKTIEIGDIGDKSSKSVEIPINVDNSIKSGKANFLFKATEKRGYSSRPVELEVPTAAMQIPELKIANCNVNDMSGLAEGDGDGAVENKETIALDPFIQNTGVGDALQVEVKITDITSGIELVQGDTNLSAINPSTTGKANLAFHVPRTFSKKQIEYTIAARDVRGITTEKTFTIPFQPQAPELYMSYQVLDDRGKEVPGLENGKDYRIKITPKNTGSNVAVGVNLQVTPQANLVSLGDFNSNIGQLDPEEAAPVVTIPVSLDRSYQENVLALDVSIDQDSFPGLSKQIKMPVRAKKPELDYQVLLMNGVSETDLTQNSRPWFRISVSNTGELAATVVKIDFQVNHPGIEFHKQKTIGTIQPGQSQYADFHFPVRGDADTGDLPVEVNIAQADFNNLNSQRTFALKKQSAIRQTVEASDGQTGGQALHAGTPDLYINTPNDNFETMEKVIPLHGSIISYGKGNAIESLSIELNGNPLKVLSGTRGNEATNRITFTRDDNKMVFDGNIKLAPGQNKITINGFDRNNKSCTKTLSISKKARLGDIYAVVIGISQFANADYNLNYAASDAKKFYRFLKSDAGGEVSDKRVSLLINHEATRPRIIKELSGFLGRAAPDDTVEIYLATHGLTGADGTLYYLCHDTETDNLRGTGFSDNDLTGIITENISAGKVILYLDACHTGLSGLSKRYAKRGVGVNEVNERINNLAIGLSKVAKTGVATFSATSSGGFSLEGKDWDGGVFTYCLVKGLQGEANENKDEWVTIKEIDNYLTKRIINLTDGKQNPRLTCPTLPIERTPLSKTELY